MVSDTAEEGSRDSDVDWPESSQASQASYRSNVTTVVLLGFYTGRFNVVFFIFLLIIYCLTICGNLLIILLVSISKTLHSPMYFFITQLSITDIILTTDVSPNMLSLVLHRSASISLSSCIAQFYFFALSEASQCVLLAVMSYDRYLAICSPLHYASIMNQVLCMKLVFLSWIILCITELILILTICRLQFCGPNTIDHFFCDLNPLINLSCSDLFSVNMEIIFLGTPVVVLPFLLIVVSYTYIVLTIFKIPSYSGRRKSFSTCSSHLTIVCIYYGTLIALYLIPNERQSQMTRKILAMLYTVLTPVLNPFIYSLRNKDIKEAFIKISNINMNNFKGNLSSDPESGSGRKSTAQSGNPESGPERKSTAQSVSQYFSQYFSQYYLEVSTAFSLQLQGIYYAKCFLTDQVQAITDDVIVKAVTRGNQEVSERSATLRSAMDKAERKFRVPFMVLDRTRDVLGFLRF
ncbi:olfactory receptor 1468-like [Hyperolius riggenbachi]|uniref:olfactory receptor 1468-like n=1 Tax=Hyperolius riggenbachi TaxID=752182 RepID=UPI0035A3537B